LGRQTADAVTTLGANVDGSVRMLTTAYDTGGAEKRDREKREKLLSLAFPGPDGRSFCDRLVDDAIGKDKDMSFWSNVNPPVMAP
jgi:hypothetical protein